MAQKKGGGSTRNGRDSKPKMLGVKAYGGQLISAGSIIVRQREQRVVLADAGVHTGVEAIARRSSSRRWPLNCRRQGESLARTTEPRPAGALSFLKSGAPHDGTLATTPAITMAVRHEIR